MSKYADEIDATYKDLNAVKRATKDVIKQGSDFAFKEFQDAESLDRIKKEVMK